METEGGLSTQRNLFFPDEPGYGIYPEVDSYAFSPDGNMLYILYNVYSEYYERSMRLQTYLWNLEGGNLYDFGKLEGVSASLEPRFAWSPEGDQILLFLTDLTEEGEYRISVYLTDLTTGEKLVLLDEAILTGSDYTYLTNLAWH
jgi:Tol biopolymer transport system component